MKTHEFRLSILAALERCGSHKLPDASLKETMRQMFPGDIADGAISNEVAWLKAKGWIDYTVSELDPSVRLWFITEEGKSRVR